MDMEFEQLCADAICYAADSMKTTFAETVSQWSRPSILMRPTLSLDGDAYCFLYGKDLMEGVAGFGDTAEAAARDFDNNWYAQKAPKLRAALAKSTGDTK